jgi:anti-sigma-K factor RskA
MRLKGRQLKIGAEGGRTLKHERATEEVREQAALYALGSMTQHEAHSYEIHLRDGCTVCETELHKYERTAAGIGLAAEEIPASDYIRDLLLARVDKEPQDSASAAETNLDETTDRQKLSQPPASNLSQPSKRSSIISWLLIAAVVLLAIQAVLSIYARKDVENTNAQLQAKLSAAESDAQNLRSQFDNRKNDSSGLDPLLQAISKPGTRVARLEGQPTAPSSSGVIFWDTAQSQCIIMGFFPTAPAGKAYQLWLGTPSSKVSVGMIQPGSNSRVFAALPIQGNAAKAIAAYVTLEPTGGSAIPTIPSLCALGRF